MPITPQTDIRILKVPIELDNKNQLTFENQETQFNYFNSLPKIEVDNCSYQRKDNVIRFPAHIDGIMQYNYVMYQNENYSYKWFYAFITNMSYINDNLTAITIATDVFQTWQFDIIYKQSFIEREMCSVLEDIPGNNLLAEGLETGEFISFQKFEIDELEPCYCIAYIGDKLGENNINQNGFSYNGIYSAITFFVTNILSIVLTNINLSGQGDKIFTVFTIPKLAVQDIFTDENTFKMLDFNFKQTPILKNFGTNNINFERIYSKKPKIKNLSVHLFGI